MKKLRFKDITGQRFGHLVAIEPIDRRVPSNGCVLWLCKCDCGQYKAINGNHLRFGTVKSCGCLKIK